MQTIYLLMLKKKKQLKCIEKLSAIFITEALGQRKRDQKLDIRKLLLLKIYPNVCSNIYNM